MPNGWRDRHTQKQLPTVLGHLRNHLFECGNPLSSLSTGYLQSATEQLRVTIRGLSSNIEDVSRAVDKNADGASEVAKTAGMVAHKAEELKAPVAGFRFLT